MNFTKKITIVKASLIVGLLANLGTIIDLFTKFSTWFIPKNTKIMLEFLKNYGSLIFFFTVSIIAWIVYFIASAKEKRKEAQEKQAKEKEELEATRAKEKEELELYIYDLAIHIENLRAILYTINKHQPFQGYSHKITDSMNRNWLKYLGYSDDDLKESEPKIMRMYANKPRIYRNEKISKSLIDEYNKKNPKLDH